MKNYKEIDLILISFPTIDIICLKILFDCHLYDMNRV